MSKTEENQSNDLSKKVKYLKKFHIVGIGASAGGLESLEKFFENMPSDSGMSFVVVQHLSPDYKSLMVELLSKHTDMPVYRIEDSTEIEPNSVYLIPPKKTLIIFHGKLLLSDMDNKHSLNLPINIFFRSLAEDQGKKSVGIILSGTGSDGTLGIREIKGAGGMVMVQDEQSAKFDGMPKSAISTGLIDYILPPDKMPKALLSYAKHPYIAESRKEDAVKDEDEVTKILAIIRSHLGVDFTYYKPNTIIRRIKRRVSLNQISSIKDYIRYLNENPKEVKTLYGELLIGVTNFFRDPEAFDTLKDKIIPKILENKNQGDAVRVWVVACSTGEEAYSIAILLKEYMEKHNTTYDIKIFASDIDETAIKTASAGIYPESIVTDINQDRLRKYFVKKNNNFQITKEIRSMILFTTHNAIKDAPFSNVDLITCRNLLIYLESVMQKKLLSLFHFSLNSNGYLFLGPSETIGDMTDSFNLYNPKWKVYQRKGMYKSLPANIFNVPEFRTSRVVNSYDYKEPTKVAEGKSYEFLYKAFLEEYLPPTIIINEDYELIHIFGDANKYMRFPKGKVTYNIKNIVVEDLSIAISTAMHKVLKSDQKIVYKNISVNAGGNKERIDMSIKSLKHERISENLIMITFEPHKDLAMPITDENVEAFDLDEKAKQYIKELELELKYTNENLQATIEELETSNEELQSTNEELLSSNEELQSTNEELQSVNEELYTVNAEYQSKIQELTELNNDINYLLAIIEIGIIFLDLNMCVRKYTPVALKVVNLLKVDIGRPIDHIHNNVVNHDITEDIQISLNKRIPVEREVQTRNGDWYLMKVHPHYSADNNMQGINVVLLDITEIKEKTQELKDLNKEYKQALERLKISEMIVNNFPNGIIMLFDHNLKIELIKGDAKKKIIDEDEEYTGKSVRFIFQRDTADDVEKHTRHALEGESEEFDICFEGFCFHVYTMPVYNHRKRITQAMLIAIETTKIQSLHEDVKVFSYAVENMPNIVVITDIEGNVEYVNKKYTEVTGYTKKEVIEKNLSVFKLAKDSPEKYQHMWSTIKSGVEWKGEFEHEKKDGSKYTESAVIIPLRNKSQRLIKFMKLSKDITEDIKKNYEIKKHKQIYKNLVEQIDDSETKENFLKELERHNKALNNINIDDNN